MIMSVYSGSDLDFLHKACLYCNIGGVYWIRQRCMSFLAFVFVMNRHAKRLPDKPT
jgi:hypothetical protein